MTNTTYIGISSIKVAPGIGMGRVGNSDEYFIGPETPGVVPVPDTFGNVTGSQPSTTDDGKYKDAAGRIKRQAQRFRVFGYDQTGTLVGEIVDGDTVNDHVVSLAWDVHVTNMKSANYAFQGKYAFDPTYLRNSTVQPGLPPAQRDKLIIDPGVKSVSGVSQAPVELVDPETSKIFDISDTHQLSGILNFANPNNPPVVDGMVDVTYTPAVVSLGYISTDAEGRLIFIGGKGESKSCTTPKVVISKTLLPSGVTEVSSDPAKAEIEKNPEYNLNSYFNNPGWYDDTCGGSINVSLCDKATGVAVLATNDAADQRGWVAVAPPHYAPASNNVVSLLDLQLDIFPESDPYSGQGPFYVAQTNGSNAIAVAALSGDQLRNDFSSLSAQASFTSVSLPTGVSVSSSPALTDYQGKNHIAFVDTAGAPYIAVEGSPGVYTVTAIASSVAATSAPAIAVLDNKLYMAFNSSGTFYLADVSATSIAFNPISQPDSVSFTNTQRPALASFNGALFMAAVDTQNQLQSGSTADASDGIIALKEVPVITESDSSADTFSQDHSVSLAYFRGTLALGYVSQSSGAVSIANSVDGTSFSSNPIAGAPQPSSDSGVSITAFNNRLYCAFESSSATPAISVGSSVDGDVFTFTTITSQGSTSPVISAAVDVNFYRDIYPILKTVTDYAWTNERAFHGHRPGTFGDFLQPTYLATLASPKSAPQSPTATPSSPNTPSPNITRSFVFNFIRPPAQQVYLNIDGTLQKHTVAPPPQPAIPTISPTPTEPVQIVSGTGVEQRADLMPRLFGNGGSPLENGINGSDFPNQWLPLTDHQLEKFQYWVNGDFETGHPDFVAYSDISAPDKLSFSALQPTVGGGFHPGIELTYLMHEEYFFNSAFRFTEDTLPGSIAAYMSVPWQGDFWSCNVSWWPALRPDIVVERTDDVPPVLSHQQWFRGNVIPPQSDGIDNYSGGYDVMVDHWHDLGLVTPVVDEHGQPVKDRGQQVFEETERNASLDTGAAIVSVENDQSVDESSSALTVNGSAITVDSSGATGSGWKLVKSTSQADYFFIQYCGGSGSQVLTVDFESGDVSLEALSPYNPPSQMWQYQATQSAEEATAALDKLVAESGSTSQPQDSVGYPGHFNFVNQSNQKLLTVAADNSVTTQSAVSLAGSDVRQIWVLNDLIYFLNDQ
ncbi:LodA/GoxA family CTQ-dependent oxidase [Arenicella sp. 4NH20-0111]|uniref:LodA/GoxA family CTQ-dependent oxidase n=1 Tax=Arenicella sp. 4NH20-0111 TaxID=3127648 RepID=UPI0033427F3C